MGDQRSAEERANWLFDNAKQDSHYDDLVHQIEAHAAQEVRRALERWGQHTEDCNMNSDSTERHLAGCSCGLTLARQTGVVP